MGRIGDRGEMEAFVRAIELGNFSAAGRELGLTPSAVSKLVTRLEHALKVRLASRSPSRIVATPEGERFLLRCRRILAEMEDAETEAGASRERPRGRLRVHAGPGFGMGPLARAVPAFVERYPEVELELVLEDRTMEIVRENIDISITVWPPQNTAVVARDLFSFGRVTCAAPAYVKRHGMPRSPEELTRHRCLRVVSTLTMPWRFTMPDGVRTIEVRPAILANNAEQCLRFVLAGLGVTQMMEFQVADYLRSGALVPVMPQWPCPDRHTMRVVYAQERYRLPRVRAMIDFLLETFATSRSPAPPAASTRRARRAG